MRRALALAALGLLLAGCGATKREAEPRLLVGAVEDAAKWSRSPARSMQDARDSGFQAVVLSAVWKREARPQDDLPPLRRAVRAAVDADVRPILDVYQLSDNTPTSPADRQAFARYAAALARALPSVREVLVGNEPNLNLFWQPQFDDAGGDAAAAAYEPLLAETYDALKAVDPDLEVIGCSLAPHGGDDPDASRPTHSPTQFIRDLGEAYRASGRDKPLMDAFSIHVYGESSRVRPTLAHPRTTTIGIADYRKLVGLLGAAFDGTAQKGSKLPIVYGEYGVETTIPPGKRADYTGREVVATVDPQRQARDYRQAIELTRRQPRVRMLFIFHVFDERRLEGLQSGVRYVDGTEKPASRAVQNATAGR